MAYKSTQWNIRLITENAIDYHVMMCSFFWATVCKNRSPYAIRPLSVLSCLSVCDVGVLWPNGWMDQDDTWHAGMPASTLATLC